MISFTVIMEEPEPSGAFAATVELYRTPMTLHCTRCGCSDDCLGQKLLNRLNMTCHVLKFLAECQGQVAHCAGKELTCEIRRLLEGNSCIFWSQYSLLWLYLSALLAACSPVKVGPTGRLKNIDYKLGVLLIDREPISVCCAAFKTVYNATDRMLRQCREGFKYHRQNMDGKFSDRSVVPEHILEDIQSGGTHDLKVSAEEYNDMTLPNGQRSKMVSWVYRLCIISDASQLLILNFAITHRHTHGWNITSTVSETRFRIRSERST